MELHGERLIPASIDATWAALNDPDTLKACIAGCESLERTGDDAYTAVVAMKIGPVSARFKGNLKMTNVAPPNGLHDRLRRAGRRGGLRQGVGRRRAERRRRCRHPARLRRPRHRRRQDGADRLAPDRRHGGQDHRGLLQGVRVRAAVAPAGARGCRRHRAGPGTGRDDTGAGARHASRRERWAGCSQPSSSSSPCSCSLPETVQRVARRRTQST